MSLTEIQQQFAACTNWQDRYRLLIQFSRQLPKLTDLEKQQLPQISGCESPLWFDFQLSPREVKCDSDARLMQGILFILRTALLEKNEAELAQFNVSELLENLHIAKHLTSTRLNGIANIQAHILQKLAQ